MSRGALALIAGMLLLLSAMIVVQGERSVAIRDVLERVEKEIRRQPMTLSQDVTRPNNTVVTVSVTLGQGTWPNGDPARSNETVEEFEDRFDAWVEHWSTH